MVRQPGESWTDFFRTLGYGRAEIIGSGMEGQVFRLTAELVGKVWHSRRAGELQPLKDFYAELIDARLPFATPEIVEIIEYAGRQVTIERYLSGESLRSRLDSNRLPTATALETTVNVVAALQQTSAGAAARALPVLDEVHPLWTRLDDSWPATLGNLVQRRAERFAEVLWASIADFDRKLDSTVALLSALPTAHSQFVHGDLCPENILVDDSGEATAVLDWGFLSTAGDNAFDAATAAGFFDMYGPDAKNIDDTLTKDFADRLGYPVQTQLLYRAAYAITGANSYGAAGTDGHFRWCAAVLNRADVTELLLTSS